MDLLVVFIDGYPNIVAKTLEELKTKIVDESNWLTNAEFDRLAWSGEIDLVGSHHNYNFKLKEFKEVSYE